MGLVHVVLCQYWGVAPFAQRSTHLALCHGEVPRSSDLAFSSSVTNILSELVGSPIMKSCWVVTGLSCWMYRRRGSGIPRWFRNRRSGCGFFHLSSHIQAERVWTDRTTVLRGVYHSGHGSHWRDYGYLRCIAPPGRRTRLLDSRVESGALADGLDAIIVGVCSIPPMLTFAQNNEGVALTRCTYRKAGHACCFSY